MDDSEVDVSTDVQVVKFLKNHHEPVVVETTTTTTTKTVTRRIHVANNTNIDIADIQTLLNNIDDDLNTSALPNIVPASADDTSKIKSTAKNKRSSKLNATKISTDNQQQNESIFSSTKIDGLTVEPDNSEHFQGNETTDTQFFSPNSSKNSIGSKIEIKQENTNQKNTNQKKMMQNSKIEGGYSTRSKGVANDKYIDGLINEYITFDGKKYARKTSTKPKSTSSSKSKGKENDAGVAEENKQKKPTMPTIVPDDLPAILETSIEEKRSPSPQQRLECASPIDFNGIDDDFDIIPENSPTHDTLKTTDKKKAAKNPKPTKNSRDKEVIRQNEKSTVTVKKRPAKKEPEQKPISKKIQTIKQESDIQSKQSGLPIKIYSPSSRGKLKPNAANKMILTKKMIEEKLQELPTSSQGILGRLSRCNSLSIDADSRLMFYPKKSEPNTTDEIDEADDLDILEVLRNKNRDLLVRAEDVDEE